MAVILYVFPSERSVKVNIQEKATKISSYTSKILRQKFGRGPESCHATISSNYLVLFIRGFISPMEEVLLEKGQDKFVDHTRQVIIGHILEELKGVVQVSLDVEVLEMFHDWNFSNNSGMMTLILDKSVEKHQHKPSFNLKMLEDEISRITAIVQKTPDKIMTVPLSENIIIVERIGILILIEKALIQKGYQEELKITKDNLEKSYFHRDANFTNIFGTHVLDLFIDWDFKEDKSIMCFIIR
ncbi:Na-translocating system protein MpsC family protein [Evansella cellulosilytica]|uniref:Na+-translocating membrane potential-generating system MpsC domain-containing protein n=1 Tax=Evansella cellulosilytica (strain ATCC 21833 / DSM 2522 / FERM P-1141 / JCM 9156 / N-4) TaxID=649639 RepID=E6TYA3_EVAC2|nr:Na-translocating system protein MpsC family protein [Evansella cellulosilytica]ADU32422.1 Protein of unknown function DUF2294 [Evansella cellulosilytica DSM 2522]